MAKAARPAAAAPSAVLLPALAGWLLLRALVLLAVLRQRPADAGIAQGLLDPLLTPDGGLVGRVAALGYGGLVRPVDGAAFADTAVLPLQPALVRLLGAGLGAEQTPATLAELSLAVSFLASLAAAAALCLLTRAVYGDRAAVATTWLWAVLPPAASLWTPAPYALLAACSAGALLAWSSGRPLAAGVLAGAAALTDPVGVAAAIAVVVGVVAAVRRRRLTRSAAAWAAVLAAGPPLAYAGWLASRRESPDAVLTVLASRARAESGARRAAEQAGDLLGSPAVLLLAGLAAAVAVGLVLAIADRQPVEVAVQAAAAVLVAGVVAPSLTAAGALSLAALGVWMPLGDALAARPRVQQAAAITVLLLICVAWTSSSLPGAPLA